MIPRDYITEWRANAPWIQDFQVEQDLVISRALIHLFSDEELASNLAFRGGTALYKLFLRPAARYSEDIDLVQMRPGPIGNVMDKIHAVLDPWLGKPQWKQNEGRVTLTYQFNSEEASPIRLKLKVEINSREHITVLGYKKIQFSVRSRWFNGQANISTYCLDELLGTKMRALFQRKKGRDLFDLWHAQQKCKVDPDQVVTCFLAYMEAEAQKITRAIFEQNLAGKERNSLFAADISPLLVPGTAWKFAEAMRYVRESLVARLPGAPWKGSSV